MITKTKNTFEPDRILNIRNGGNNEAVNAKEKCFVLDVFDSGFFDDRV
jgi:hypothetical protein